jgi:hypothetical protein
MRRRVFSMSFQENFTKMMKLDNIRPFISDTVGDEKQSKNNNFDVVIIKSAIKVLYRASKITDFEKAGINNIKLALSPEIVHMDEDSAVVDDIFMRVIRCFLDQYYLNNPSDRGNYTIIRPSDKVAWALISTAGEIQHLMSETICDRINHSSTNALSKIERATKMKSRLNYGITILSGLFGTIPVMGAMPATTLDSINIAQAETFDKAISDAEIETYENLRREFEAIYSSKASRNLAAFFSNADYREHLSDFKRCMQMTEDDYRIFSRSITIDYNNAVQNQKHDDQIQKQNEQINDIMKQNQDLIKQNQKQNQQINDLMKQMEELKKSISEKHKAFIESTDNKIRRYAGIKRNSINTYGRIT